MLKLALQKKYTDKFPDHLKVLFTTCTNSHQLEALVYLCFLEFKNKISS